MRFELDVVRGRDGPTILSVEAASTAEAESQVRQQGFAVIGRRASAGNWQSTIARGLPRQSSTAGASLLLEQLRDLLQAGLSVIEALVTLRQTAAGPEGERLDGLISRLKGGERLSGALAAEPGWSPLLIDLVRASEQTSDLPGALSRYLEHDGKVNELRHRITSIALYPALLTLVGGGVLLFLLFYVMPRFARVFEGMTGTLPWSAQAMVAWSRLLSANGTLIVGSVAAVMVGLAAIASLQPLRQSLFRGLLGWGPVRDHLRVYFLARWYRTTGMLCAGGIPLPQSLELANGVLPEVLRPGGRNVLDAIRAGLGPADAYQRSDMATPVAAQLMRAGERTGNLGEVLGRVASFHDVALERTLERRMRALEPIVMVLIGLAVGIIVVLMYLPIFELASAIR